MRALLVREHGAPESLVIEDLPTPEPGPGEVLVDVRAIGINYPDLLVIGGKYQILPPRPFIPGKDLAGVVRAVGDGVVQCRPGDRVMAQVEHGAYAEQAVVPEAQCFVIPGSMSYEQAAAMSLVYQTAHFALIDRCNFKEGETVLVNGAAGGVGLAAVQLVRGMGGRALAGVIDDDQAKLVRENGAHAVIDLSRENLRESLREQVHAATDGRGTDIVLDPVGGEVFTASLRAMAWRGRLCVIGFTSGEIPTLKANYLLVKNITVSGLQWSDYRDRDPAWVRRVQTDLFRLFEAGRIDPRVMATYPMEQAATALNLVKKGQVRGKVVLTTGQ
ncbi:MAG: NADPH:quinone oxidoreductase [Rhodospirillaceae bacterium]|nr:NADPH:quinone oxidoreductase [Rhodospirillaceae bacterium]